MITTNQKRNKLVQVAIFCAAMLFSGLIWGKANVIPPGHFADSGEHYIDGAVTWKKPIAKVTYDNAAQFCAGLSKKDSSEFQWNLPTRGQYAALWHSANENQSQITKFAEHEWYLNQAWIQDDADGIKNKLHTFVHLGTGIDYKTLSASEQAEKYALCIRTPKLNSEGEYFDGAAYWSKIKQPGLTYKEARKYCDDKLPQKEWGIPTNEELIGFFQTVLAPHALDNYGWDTPVPLWSSTPVRSGVHYKGHHDIYLTLPNLSGSRSINVREQSDSVVIDGMCIRYPGYMRIPELTTNPTQIPEGKYVGLNFYNPWEDVCIKAEGHNTWFHNLQQNGGVLESGTLLILQGGKTVELSQSDFGFTTSKPVSIWRCNFR